MRDKKTQEKLFDRFSQALVGLSVSHVWRGYGSAIFLEFGLLRRTTRLDGAKGNPSGKMTLMIEWSWRIEGPQSILCGSWSDAPRWPKFFAKLTKTKVVAVSLLGRLNEIDIELSNGMHVVSFSTIEGQPHWSLGDRESKSWLYAKSGKLFIEKQRTRK